MDINTFESVRSAVHVGSLIIFCLVILVSAIAAFKPALLRGIFKEFAERKYILGGAVFVSLLCGTVFTATQPVSKLYENSTAGSNTSGSLSQPSRQVPDEPQQSAGEPTTEFGANDEVMGTPPNNSTRGAQQQPQNQAAAAQPAPSQNNSEVSSAPTQRPVSQPPANPPNPQPQKPDCSVKVLFVCL